MMIFNKKLKKFYFSHVKEEKIQTRGSVVWVHASSVGEVNLSETLVEKLSKQYEVILSVMTDTGLSQAQQLYQKNDRVIPFFFPLDNPRCIQKIVNRHTINLLILIETEIWPNLISIVSKKSKILLVNGRISDKSVKNYRRLKFLFSNALKNISFFLMQTENDRDRIIELGAAKESVLVMGNLKFCLEISQFSESELSQIVEKFTLANSKVIVLGSTHPKEEEFFLPILKELKESEKLFLVPRHINRIDEVLRMLQTNQINYSLFDGDVKKDAQIIVVNCMGVLRKLYAISDICFVGGTIDETGGHNLLEPLYYRRISLFGPNTLNVKEIATELKFRKLGIEFETPENFRNLIDTEAEWQNSEKKSEIVNFFEENIKALECVEIKIQELLEKK